MNQDCLKVLGHGFGRLPGQFVILITSCQRFKRSGGFGQQDQEKRIQGHFGSFIS